MNFDDMNEAVRQAQATLSMTNRFVGKMASLVAGRLRNSDAAGSVPKKLKQELADYNIHTGKWKDPK